MDQFERAFVMFCNNRTERECLERNLFGDQAKRFQHLHEIKPGDIGFLLNADKDELMGVFQAASEPELHIEPDAWGGRFAAQVRVKLICELQRVKDATFILKKVGLGMRELASGALVPESPVHGRDVGQKIMAHFRQSMESINRHNNETDQ